MGWFDLQPAARGAERPQVATDYSRSVSASGAHAKLSKQQQQEQLEAMPACSSPIFELELLPHRKGAPGSTLMSLARARGAAAGAVPLERPSTPLAAPPRTTSSPPHSFFLRSFSDVALRLASDVALQQPQQRPQQRPQQLQLVPGACAQAMLRLQELCAPADQFEEQLASLVRALRHASSDGLARSSAPAITTSTAPPSPRAGGATAAMPDLHPRRPDLSPLAAELRSHGYVVQMHQGGVQGQADECGVAKGAGGAAAAAQSMQLLQHQFLTCKRTAVTDRSGQQSSPGGQAGGRGRQQLQQHAPLPPGEAVIVEPRFRELFAINISTGAQAYDFLLLAVPHTFVGTLPRLEAAVSLLAAEIANAFRGAGRALPPWRMKAALLSRWPAAAVAAAAAAAAAPAADEAAAACAAGASAHAKDSAAQRPGCEGTSPVSPASEFVGAWAADPVWPASPVLPQGLGVEDRVSSGPATSGGDAWAAWDDGAVPSPSPSRRAQSLGDATARVKVRQGALAAALKAAVKGREGGPAAGAHEALAGGLCQLHGGQHLGGTAAALPRPAHMVMVDQQTWSRIHTVKLGMDAGVRLA